MINDADGLTGLEEALMPSISRVHSDYTTLVELYNELVERYQKENISLINEPMARVKRRLDVLETEYKRMLEFSMPHRDMETSANHVLNDLTSAEYHLILERDKQKR